MKQGCRRFLLALLVAPLALPACSRGPTAQSVIVISVDTLRADRLGCYGHDGPTSPHIDSFAREGAIFEDASSTSPWTLPAHASLLSGRYPTRHGVRTIGRVLPQELPTIASVVREHGFATGAVANLHALEETHRLLSSFDSVEIVPSDQSAMGAARRVTEAATSWLASAGHERTLLFVHYYDVHSDYRSEPEIERLFAERAHEREGSTDHLLGIMGGMPLAPEGVERLLGLYDAGIRQLDAELGRFFDWLRERGRLEDTLIVLTSDHGEEFFDHAPTRTTGVSHGHSLYQELVRVPLLLRGPGIAPGTRVTAPVSLVDVMSTVLDALDVEAPTGIDGTSLLPLLDGREQAVERPLFFEASQGLRAATLKGVRRGPFKLVVDVSTGRSELYDLASDPGEMRDLSEERPEVVGRLEQDLRWIRAQHHEAETRELSDDAKERLRALGYL